MSIWSVVTLNTMAAAYRWDIKLIYTSLKPVALSSCHIHPSRSETLPLATELHRAQPIGSHRASLSLSLSLSKAQRWLRDCSVMKGIQEASGGQTWSNKPVLLWPAAARTPGMRVCIKREKKKVLREPGGARLQAPFVFTLTMGHTNGCKSKWLCWSSVPEPTQTNWVNQTGDSWQDRECE